MNQNTAAENLESQVENTGVVHKEEIMHHWAAPQSRKFRLLLILGVLIFSLAGQFMLRTDQPLIGAIFIVLAALFFVVIFRDQPGPGNWLTTETLGRQLFKLNWWGGISLVLAILFAALAFWLFGEDIPEYFPWLAHRISIGLLIFSSFWLNKSTGISESQSNNKKWNWLEVGIFLAILVIAAFMRLYRLNQIPFGLWYDEADDGVNALRLLNSPEYLPVFVKSTALPAHYIYIIAFFFRILGVSTFSLRAVSVVFGLATVVAAFFTGQELFNRKLGLALAFFLAVARWDIIWSRIGMHGVSVPFFELLSVGFILQALRKQRLVDYSLAGLSLGLGLCFYPPLRLFPVVVGAFLLFLCLHRRDVFFLSWRGFLFLALAAIIVSIPISQFAIREPEIFFGRMKVVSIFTGKSSLEGWKAVAGTTHEHLLMFNYQGDNNGRHNLPGEPMLDPITGALLVLGVGLSLWRIRQPGSFLLLAWLLIMLVPAIFSLDFESPQSYRAIGSLPAAYLLAVVPIHALWQEWQQVSGKYSPALFILPFVIMLGAAGYSNYHVYFDLQAENSVSWLSFSTPETIIGKEIAGLDPQADVYVSIYYYDSPTIKFLAPNKAFHRLETYDTFPIPSDGKKTMAFFVEAGREQLFLQAKQYYLNADFKEYKDPSGNVVLYQIILSPSDIEASQGITASYYRNANWQEQPFLVTTEPTINVDWKDVDPSQFPSGVKWQGVLYADFYGPYRLILHSPSPAELYLDDVQIHLVEEGDGVQTVEVVLAKGSHDLVLKTLEKKGHFELDWTPPGEQKQVLIPASNYFLPPISNNGLLGYYFANENWQGPPAVVQVNPWIHFYYYTQLLPVPFTVEWVGRININEEGRYGFMLDSVDESTLFIDDEQVTSENKEGGIYLSPGFHEFRLRYVDRANYAHINLYWIPPGSDWENIPQDVLFLP
jgi:4-amino-4-deoxy-L-arabinose transferase-like glycosyltransferase